MRYEFNGIIFVGRRREYTTARAQILLKGFWIRYKNEARNCVCLTFIVGVGGTHLSQLHPMPISVQICLIITGAFLSRKPENIFHVVHAAQATLNRVTNKIGRRGMILHRRCSGISTLAGQRRF